MPGLPISSFEGPVPSIDFVSFTAGLTLGLIVAVTLYARYVRTLIFGKRAVRKAEEQIKNFLSSIGHEVRTPLNGILGSSTLLSGTSLTKDQRDSVDIIHRSANNILQILEGVVDYIALSEGHLAVTSEPMDLRAVVEDAIDRNAASLIDRNVDINSLFSTKIPASLVGDAARVVQIVSCLIGCASETLIEGEMRITLRLVDRDIDRSVVQVEIACIEKSGSQLGPVAAALHDSSLIIYLCRSLARALGGFLETDFSAPSGACFWLVLNLPHGQEAVQVPEPLTGAAIVFSRNISTAESMQRHCELIGLKTSAASYSRGLFAAVQQRVDDGDRLKYVLADLADLDFSTVELCRRVAPGPLLIFGVTSAPDHEWPALKMEYGLDGLVSKPLRRSRLREALVHSCYLPGSRLDQMACKS